MVTSPLLQTADLPVKLPKAITIESKERNIAITQSTDGRLGMNTDIITLDQMVAELTKLVKKDPDMLIILRVDQTSSYLSLTDLIVKCKKAGARNISIGTEQKKVNG
jgi:biopolymer transport protein ExbD